MRRNVVISLCSAWMLLGTLGLSLLTGGKASAQGEPERLDCHEDGGDAVLLFWKVEGSPQWSVIVSRSLGVGSGTGPRLRPGHVPGLGPQDAEERPLEFPCVNLPPRGDGTFEEVAFCGGPWGKGRPKIGITLGFGGFLHAWSASAKSEGVLDAFFFCRPDPGGNDAIWGNSKRSHSSKDRSWRAGAG